MTLRTKYDAFAGKKGEPLHIVYPELAFIISGLYLGDSAKVDIDTVLRFVVYFYDLECLEIRQHTDILKAREASLMKFKIPMAVADSPYFRNAENEMALRYMTLGCDNKFNVFISLSIQLSNMLAKIRERNDGSTWSDNMQSLKSSSEILSISENLDAMRKALFGDMKHIEQYAMQKELDAMFKAETGML